MAPMAPSDPLTAPLELLDPAWLSTRRWFRSKTRPLRAVSVDDAISTELGGEILVLLATFADGGEERYLVPVVADADGPREPADGDGLWRSLMALMADGPHTLTSRRGGLVLEPGPALAQMLPGGRAEALGLAERGMGAEQTNTSIRLGERLMLKIYRLLEPGINPEVELTEFLTDHGFDHAPLAAGSARYVTQDAEPAAALIAQSLIPARGDAWGWMLSRLGSPPGGPVEALAAATEIGGVTSELHRALQSDPELPGFPSRPATEEELRAWRDGAVAQLEGALSAVSGDERARLEAVAARVRQALDLIPDATTARVCRIHGDYHLGQLLTTDSGFVVTDFEGEPARPLVERRRPASPLRDVAGMLRSLDYAAHAAERGPGGLMPEPWLADAHAAFLAAYGGDHQPGLLRAFELEKACYEVRYEANFRPDWISLPLGAIERLVEAT
jgi:predicted trehalose synthase